MTKLIAVLVGLGLLEVIRGRRHKYMRTTKESRRYNNVYYIQSHHGSDKITIH